MMHMTLYWGKEVTLLLNSWKTESWPSYGLALLLCFFVAVFFQRLEALRLKFSNPQSSTTPYSRSVNSPLLINRKPGPNRTIRIASALLFGVNSAIGYLIMLVIMSYNGGVFLAVILGLIVGYYLFRSGDFGDGADDFVAVDTSSLTCACS
ncbi:hypothetical protein ACJIZ3_021450 [Penstemon smallii]|uniref:Copper transport protein n=1 Tax=Penstemon smallii TaxID=265156 RepID=A0ABD3SM02_9LAMI